MAYFSYGAPAGSLDPTQGIVISYIHTLDFDDEPIYSEDGVEYLYTKRTLRIEGTLNANLQPALSPTETPSIQFARIQQTLEQPRLQLFFFHNDKTDPSPLIQSPQPNQQVDAKNGPYPKRVKLVRFGGSECLFVQLEYETYIVDCGSDQATPEYLSHRFTESVAIDERFYTTKTRTGKIFVRSDLTGVNPDFALRGLVTPSIDPGFKRIKAEYTLQSDGLALMYTFVDQEVYIEPPFPAVKASGEYVESTPNGGKLFAECRVKLEGSKATDKGILLETAILIAVTKLKAAGVDPNGVVVAGGGLKTDLYDNVVEVRLRGYANPNLGTFKNVNFDLGRFTDPPVGSDDGVPPDYGIRGTAGLLLIADALKDPCLSQHVLTGTDTGDPQDDTGGLGPNPSILTTGTPPPVLRTTPKLPDGTSLRGSRGFPSTLRGNIGGGFYDNYEIASKNLFDENIIKLATCNPGAPAAIVQLAAGTMDRVVEGTATRVGAWPELPPPDPGDGNTVLKRVEITPEEVRLAGDGVTPILTVHFRYEYAQIDRTQVKLNSPVPPYLDSSLVGSIADAPTDNTLKTSGIVDTTGGGTSQILPFSFPGSIVSGS